MERKTHYFYAVKIPGEQKNLLRVRAAEWKKVFPFKRWVHHEDYHITLAFLGGAGKEPLLQSVELVREAVSGSGSFPLTLGHLGVFGRKDFPRVFWAGTHEEKRLFALRESVYRACTEAGFSLDTRPFHPHLTLARTWESDKRFSGEWLEKYDSLRKTPISFSVNEIVLYETHLERIPKYEAIRSFSLT